MSQRIGLETNSPPVGNTPPTLDHLLFDSTMVNTDDYTIGWVCATTTEYVVSQALLDEKHDGPEYLLPPSKTDYTLGKMGEHNIVISVLSTGEHGMPPVARTSKDIISIFPNVRVALIVGIGGGVPSKKHDIRLGDVVVSASRDSLGGVIQYDLGKTTENQSFQPTSSRSQPPTILQTAVDGLRYQYEREGHQLEKTINEILKKKPQLQQEYKRPGPTSDRLYQSHVIHSPDGELPCALVCHDDPSCLVLRDLRTENSNEIAIHYGLIASANQIMKDALLRDKVAAQKDILCFEIEAAGLMKHFPCLMIRGICDYADSHQNKDWQVYATMVAAAYAKDLLYQVVPQQVEKEAKIVDILQDHHTIIPFSGGNSGLQMGVNHGCIYFERVESTNSAFFVSSNIQGRPPVSTGGPKQGSAGQT